MHSHIIGNIISNYRTEFYYARREIITCILGGLWGESRFVRYPENMAATLFPQGLEGSMKYSEPTEYREIDVTIFFLLFNFLLLLFIVVL